MSSTELMIIPDTTMANVALPPIRSDLGFSETSLAWVVNAYMLTSAVTSCSMGGSASAPAVAEA